MTQFINKVTLLGVLVRDPDLRVSPSATKIANLLLATTRSWVDRRSETLQEKSEWHRIVVFGNDTIMNTIEHLQEGNAIYLEGRLQSRKWVDQGGREHRSVEIILDRSFGTLVPMVLNLPSHPHGDRCAAIPSLTSRESSTNGNNCENQNIPYRDEGAEGAGAHTLE